MRYFRILGEMMRRRSPSKIWQKVLGILRLDIKRSSSAQSKPLVIVCNISGWTLVASTNRTTPSSQRLLTLCFAGIAMRLNATYICKMFRQMNTTRITCPLSHGKRPFGKADGSPEAGHYKSLLLHHRLNSFPERASESVIRSRWGK
jgi:hypothetical protein